MKLIVENFVTMIAMLFISTIFFSIIQIETEILMHQNILYAKIEEVSTSNLNYEECAGFVFEVLDNRAIRVRHVFDIVTPFFGTVYENYQMEGIAR